MGILSSAYQALRDEIYQNVPEMSCAACGQCCVSPHMTLIEFCYLMTSLREKPDQLLQILSRMVPAHPEYHGNLLCRFQTQDNHCGVYEQRALVCRLHGHPVLKRLGLQYHVHCTSGERSTPEFTPDEVYGLMDRLTELNQGYYSYYSPPYWVSGLNTEAWLTPEYFPPAQKDNAQGAQPAGHGPLLYPAGPLTGQTRGDRPVPVRTCHRPL